MKIKIGDYIKLKDGSDWKRVCCLCDAGYVNVDEYVFPLDIDNITEVLHYGELVEVSRAGDIWEKQIFIAYDKEFSLQFRCVKTGYTKPFNAKGFVKTDVWKYARPIPAKVKITWENKEKWISKDDAKALFGEDKL